jgi:uncharacterized protein YndB with AHSA1/START domain
MRVPHAIRQGDIPGVQLRCDARLTASRQEVWRWLTETDRLRLWLASEIEQTSEDELRLTGETEDGAPRIERARTVMEEEGRLLVLSFERLEDGWESATKLSFELRGETPCDLSVLQQGFERLALSRCLTVWEFYRRRWRVALERLDAEIGCASTQLTAD